MPHTWKGEALQLRCFRRVLWLLKDAVCRGLSLQSQGRRRLSWAQKGTGGEGHDPALKCIWNFMLKHPWKKQKSQEQAASMGDHGSGSVGARRAQGFAGFPPCKDREMPCARYFLFPPRSLYVFLFPQNKNIVCILVSLYVYLVSTKSYLLIILHKVTCSNSLI